MHDEDDDDGDKMKRKVAGYFGKMENGFGKGSIKKPIMEHVWDSIQCVKHNVVPIMGVCSFFIGVVGLI